MKLKRMAAALLMALGAARAAQAGKAVEHDDPLDVVIEQMAQHIVFHDALEEAERKLLAANGYSAGPNLRGTRALVFRVFTSSRPDRPTVVAFRGTKFTRINSLMNDLDPRAIGYQEFRANRELIERTLAQAAQHGPVLVAGFSLGGALAQRTASELPKLVSRVVTFHTPGIERSAVESLRRYNQSNPAQAIRSDHYQLEKDIVGEAGDAFTDGTIHEYRLESSSPKAFFERHTSYILADEALARGQVLPAHDRPLRIVYVEDRPSSAKKTTGVEKLREVVGTLATGTAKEMGKGKKAVRALEH